MNAFCWKTVPCHIFGNICNLTVKKKRVTTNSYRTTRKDARNPSSFTGPCKTRSYENLYIAYSISNKTKDNLC